MFCNLHISAKYVNLHAKRRRRIWTLAFLYVFLHTPNSKVRKYTRKTEASYLLVDVSIFVRVFTRKMEDSHLHRTAKYVNLHAKRRHRFSTLAFLYVFLHAPNSKVRKFTRKTEASTIRKTGNQNGGKSVENSWEC